MTNADAIVYGVASPQDIAALSGRQVLQAMIDGVLPAPPMAGTLGFLLVEVDDGFAAFEGETGAHLLNPMGTVHGGWALTMIDSVTTCAALSMQPPGVACTTVETKANFTRPIQADTGRVRAEGRILSRGRQLVTAEAKVTDARGRLLAHGTSTLLVLGASRP
ncbi:MAG: PaaI family thioesterase [Roseiarcus sp.]|jgi:uncharacterized protein (TIGR00369 family)